MQTYRVGDKIEIQYKVEPAQKAIMATLFKFLTDAQEGMSGDVEFYAVGWMEFYTTSCADTHQTIMLGNDGAHYLDGRPRDRPIGKPTSAFLICQSAV